MTETGNDASISARRAIIQDAKVAGVAALPTLVWYVVWRVGGASLPIAAAAALATGTATLIATARKRNLRLQAVGLLILGISVASAMITGSARNYFLPGIFLHTMYAVGFLTSVVIRRPLVGVALSIVLPRWHLKHTGHAGEGQYALLTLLWATKFAVEAVTLGYLYTLDNVDLLVIARLVLRGPADLACVAISVLVLSRRSGSPPS